MPDYTIEHDAHDNITTLIPHEVPAQAPDAPIVNTRRTQAEIVADGESKRGGHNTGNLVLGGVPREERLLTPMQLLFVEYYCGAAHFNASEAARLAGYDNPASGTDNKRLPAVRALIDALLDAEALTRSEILAELRTLALAPTEHFGQLIRPSFKDKDGNQYDAVVKLDYGAKVRALELLGKGHRMWVESSEVTHTGEVIVREYREGSPQIRPQNDPQGGGI